MKNKLYEKSVLYRQRFVIGYVVLALAFLLLIFGLPMISPRGLSRNEMESVVETMRLSQEGVLAGDVINLPYRMLQRLAIEIFGASTYVIKLPNMLLGIILGIFMILLLNRWFRSNVALVASVIAVLGTPFLYLSGMGTPMIMFVLYPTILFWIGSKIQGESRPKPLLCLSFAVVGALALFTPYMIYFLAGVALYTFMRPHLRFVIRNLPWQVKVLVGLVATIVITGTGYLVVAKEVDLSELLWPTGFMMQDFERNADKAFLPFFAWNTTLEGVMLSPMIGLSTLALAMIGFVSTSRKLFASKSAVAFAMFIFTAVVAGIDPEFAILAMMPATILVAHGISYIFTRWYSIFPENPYARVLALIPISGFLLTITLGSLSHFIFGYRYTPAVANHFNNDLEIIRQQLGTEDVLLISAGTLEYDFYTLMQKKTGVTVTSNLPESLNENQRLATLGLHTERVREKFELTQIITSSKMQNSDRIYLYTVKK